MFPEILKLATLCLLIPQSAREVFSTQNRIKTKLRNRMGSKRLDMLMRISEEGPKLSDFDFEQPVEKWGKMKERRIYNKLK